ncbi:MAG: TIGR04149 family rSAM-modified RiPP [Prevotellaceae bacterium]|jgi:natural product precursor|nr:TIGR04149 family rSAM-modified RiPP [Prevotellaceae bacterium]
MKKIKLNILAKNTIKEKEMNQIKGGGCCACGCMYVNQGGSGTIDNHYANKAHGLKTPGWGCIEI